jgi:two-component system, chemotaxis family, CheB/CheR fusion protein
VNEEMQSTNEELEASKEELQSVNEELHTVNAELSGKIDALDRANSDLQNLFESTDVATVFLDKNLVIRSFTPAVAEIFSILPGDRGRPITDLSSRLSFASFSEDIIAVCTDHRTIERRLENIDHTKHFLTRIAPYHNGVDRNEGAVVTFVDITNLVRADARQRVLIAELQHRTRNLLGIVQSIAQQTLGKGGTLEAFSTRLAALGRVQSLVGGAMEDLIDLRDIVHLELEAVGAPADGRVNISGPRVSLGLELIQTFGLALHELATNAAKYGALKKPGGHLLISWSVSGTADSPVLLLDWRESGIDLTPQPSRRGFGLELIKRALPFTLRAKVEHTFEPGGVSCHIELPLKSAAVSPATGTGGASNGGSHGTSGTSDPHR